MDAKADREEVTKDVVIPEILGVDDMMTPGDENHLVPAVNSPEMLFSDKANIERMVALIRRKATENEIDADLTTKTGREKLKSQAYLVTRSKTFLVGLGKEMASDMRSRVKAIDDMCRFITQECDSLRDEIKAPAIKAEQAEEKRLAALKERLQSLNQLFNIYDPVKGRMTTEMIKARLDKAEATVIDDSWDEFRDEALAAKNMAVQSLTISYDAAVKADEAEKKRAEEAAELERVRAENARIAAELKAAQDKEAARKAEEERKAAEEKAAKEAAEKAKADAEAKAKADAEAAKKKAQAEKDAAVAKAKAEAEAKAKAEQEAKEAEIRAEAERKAKEEAEAEAQRREKEAAERAKAEAEAKAKAEAEAKAKAAAEEKARRVADVAHRRQVNRNAASDLMEAVHELTEAQAQNIVEAVVKGMVRRMTLEY